MPPNAAEQPHDPSHCPRQEERVERVAPDAYTARYSFYQSYLHTHTHDNYNYIYRFPSCLGWVTEAKQSSRPIVMEGRCSIASLRCMQTDVA